MPTSVSAAAIAQQVHWWVSLAAWGNIGSLLGGLAAVALALAAIITGSAGLGDWRAKQRAEAEVAHAEAENIRLDRHRSLYGWSPGMVNVYRVELVTERSEMEQAQEQLTHGRGSDYVILRVNDSPSGNENRAKQLRDLIANSHMIARAPLPAEREALEVGSRALVDEERAALTN